MTLTDDVTYFQATPKTPVRKRKVAWQVQVARASPKDSLPAQFQSRWLMLAQSQLADLLVQPFRYRSNPAGRIDIIGNCHSQRSKMGTSLLSPASTCAACGGTLVINEKTGGVPNLWLRLFSTQQSVVGKFRHGEPEERTDQEGSAKIPGANLCREKANSNLYWMDGHLPCFRARLTRSRSTGNTESPRPLEEQTP